MFVCGCVGVHECMQYAAIVCMFVWKCACMLTHVIYIYMYIYIYIYNMLIHSSNLNAYIRIYVLLAFLVLSQRWNIWIIFSCKSVSWQKAELFSTAAHQQQGTVIRMWQDNHALYVQLT